MTEARWFLNPETLKGSAPSDLLVMAAVLMAFILLLMIAWRRLAYARSEGLFDEDLWERVLTLIHENRCTQAIALCRTETGFYPRLYLAGLEEYDRSPEKASYRLLMEKESSLEPIRRETFITGAITVFILAAGALGGGLRMLLEAGFMSGKPAAQILNSAQEILLSPLMGLWAVPFVALFFYNIFVLNRLARGSGSCIGQMLKALSEKPKPVPQAARQSWGARVQTNEAVPAPTADPHPIIALRNFEKMPPVPEQQDVWADVSRHS